MADGDGMRRITVEEGDTKVRFTRSESEPFRWAMEAWFDDHWTEMPRMSDTLDGRDVLWQCATTIGVGEIARGE